MPMIKYKLYEVKFKVNGSKRKHAKPYESYLKLVKEFQDLDSATTYIHNYLLKPYGSNCEIGLPSKGVLNYRVGRYFYSLIPQDKEE